MNRRTASVWNWCDAVYDYYAIPSLLDAGEDPRPPKPMAPLRPPLGDPPERLLRPLPAGAVYTGRGLRALGEVMVLAAGRP